MDAAPALPAHVAPDISRMDHAELFQHLWNTEIVPEHNERIKRESERRADAFADTTLTVCGEELRMMTARDLYILDALENPLVSGGLPKEIDCAKFIWLLHAENDGTASLRNRFRRGRILTRVVNRADVAETVAEIEEFIDRMMIDTEGAAPDSKDGNGGKETEKKPPNTHFISSLLMRIASEIGDRDPMSGQLLGDTPLPRLLQYGRDLDKLRGNDSGKYGSIDSIRVNLMDRVNTIIMARGVAKI